MTDNPKMLKTLVSGEYVLLDLDQVWREEFARWDCLVPAGVAARVSDAVVDALEAEKEVRS